MEHSREQQQKQQQQQAAAAAALHRRVATIVRHIAMPISSSSSSCQKQQQRPCSKQLLPSSDQQQIHVEICSCSSSGSETSERRRSSNKYERLHGSVSRELPVWTQPAMLSGPPFEDILYEKAQEEAIAKITINRPERRNAFRPLTVMELKRAFDYARDDPEVGVVIFTGKGTEAFCSGGDQAVRGKHGYVGSDNIGRLNILDVQVQIRRLPKPVIAMVAGYAVGGGHVLHMVCDLTIAADNAVFGQTGPKVGSFDAGYGCSMMARLIGQKRAREMWFLARFYSAQEAISMGLINTVVPLEKLEEETVVWCRKILQNSPMAIRLLKSALNAVEDGHAGLQELAGNATLLFYGSDEAIEGKTAYLEGRKPDFSKFPRLP